MSEEKEDIVMAEKEDLESKENDKYLPSLNTGLFGTYLYEDTIKLYYPSYNTGIFGTYMYPILNSIETNSNKTSKEPIKIPRNKYGVKILQCYSDCYISPTKDNRNNKRPKGNLYICQGSVIDFSGDAIINAANEGCLGGGGVDGAITNAGGDLLAKYRKKLPLLDGQYKRCETGDAKITKSGKGADDCFLKCDYVIHAVGPIYGYSKDYKEKDNLLYNAYANSMKRAKETKIKSIGFCLISAGIFRGGRSLDVVLSTGIKACCEHMYDGAEVYIIGFTGQEIATLKKVAPTIIRDPDNVIFVDNNNNNKKGQARPKKGFLARFSPW